MLCYVLWFEELQEQPRALQIKLFSISILRPDLFLWLLLEIERSVRWIDVQNSFYIYSIWLSTYLPTSYFIQQSSWRLKGLAQGPRGNSLTVARFEHSAGLTSELSLFSVPLYVTLWLSGQTGSVLSTAFVKVWHIQHSANIRQINYCYTWRTQGGSLYTRIYNTITMTQSG